MEITFNIVIVYVLVVALWHERTSKGTHISHRTHNAHPSKKHIPALKTTAAKGANFGCRGYIRPPVMFLGLHNQLLALISAIASARAANATLLLPRLFSNYLFSRRQVKYIRCSRDDYSDPDCTRLDPFHRFYDSEHFIRGLEDMVCIAAKPRGEAVELFYARRVEYKPNKEYWGSLGAGVLKRNGALMVGYNLGFGMPTQAVLSAESGWQDYIRMLSRILTNLIPSPYLRRFSDTLIEFMKRVSPGGRFIGLHLRVEKDVHMFHKMHKHGRVPTIKDVSNFMSRKNVSAVCKCDVIYVATGDKKENWVKEISQGGKFKVYTKHDIMPEISSIRHREILSLIEAEVLAHSEVFLGLETSSMSHLLKYRVLLKGKSTFDYRAPEHCQNRLCRQEFNRFHIWVYPPLNASHYDTNHNLQY